MTTTYGAIGDVHVFSHAWLHKSAEGASHNGGFWGGGPEDSGFYGSSSEGDHADARTLSDLQKAIENGSVKLHVGGEIFLEGCHIGETGTFVSQLRAITGRVVISACGSSTEQTDANGKIYFRSAPENQAELVDTDYDGWLRDSAKIGSSYYAW
jgi:hypothetical protein